MKYVGKYSPAEILRQVEIGKGDFYDDWAKEIAYFANESLHVECLIAVDLCEFYFGIKESGHVCFVKKDDSEVENIESLAELKSVIKQSDDVDFVIRNDKASRIVQLKRYPGLYLKFDKSSILSFLTKKMAGYTETNNTFALLLQPRPEDLFSFELIKDIHDDLLHMKDKINFGEILIVFNLNNEKMTLARVYPSFDVVDKPIVWREPAYIRSVTRRAREKIEE